MNYPVGDVKKYTAAGVLGLLNHTACYIVVTPATNEDCEVGIYDAENDSDATTLKLQLKVSKENSRIFKFCYKFRTTGYLKYITGTPKVFIGVQ
jgi:hypothetical protein